MKEHIPKKHLDLENPIVTDKRFDSTADRIYGESRPEIMRPTCLDYGTGKNPADAMPRVGRKTQAIEKMIAAEVQAEMEAKAAQVEAERNRRFFQTTKEAYHCGQPLTENVVGRKVMRTQDGQLVDMAARDQQLIVETGMFRRQAQCSDEELRARVPVGDYTQTRPVTIYTEALERKNTYMSAATGPNPFAVTRGFTQPLNQTKAVVHHEGNINFEKEQRTVDTMRTTGRDLNIRNPYNHRECTVKNFAAIREQVMASCSKQASGLRALRLLFDKFDSNKNGSLEATEFKNCMASFGVCLNEDETSQCLKYFDTNKDGKISFQEFLGAVRGDLSENRRDAIHQAFFKVDPHMTGCATIQQLECAYNAASPADLAAFLSVWGTVDKRAQVSLQDFQDYYHDLSATAGNEATFIANLRAAWRM